MTLTIIKPDWPVAKHIHAFTSTRLGGVSQGIYHGLNLAHHVDDEPDAVQANRDLLQQQFHLPHTVKWLQQIHSTQAIAADTIENGTKADALYTNKANTICAVLTADCLPILVCNKQGDKIAAIHAGWRGLASGIIQTTLEKLAEPADHLLLWFGPAIGARHYQVGQDFYDTFLSISPMMQQAFKQTSPTHWHADIYALAKLQCEQLGIKHIYGGEHCTFADSTHFYSHRRDGTTGRMASLIWFGEGACKNNLVSWRPD